MSALVVAGAAIRQDAAGRFCLNDLHRAAGGEARHQPAFFVRRKETAELIDALGASADSQTPLTTVNDGRNNGTFVAKELVYAYAMWISPAFHLKVIRAYDALVTKPAGLNAANLSRLELLQLAMQAEEERLALQHQVAEQAPKVAALDHIAASSGSMCITDAAKKLHMRPGQLFDWLQEHEWTYRRGGKWVARQPKLDAGLMEQPMLPAGRYPDGTPRVDDRARITAKGLTVLAQLLIEKSEGALL